MYDELYHTISSIIERDRESPKINASWVANEALKEVDPNRISIPCVYNGCLEHAKQYARGILRKKFDLPYDHEELARQHELFTDLQWRYPSADEAAERAYVLRGYRTMSRNDSLYNINRFRSASESLAKHADALETWENRREITA